MAVLLDLAPSVEARLRAEAHLRDMSVSQFVTMLLGRVEDLNLDGPEKTPLRRDASVLLDEAVREMKENQIKYRELLVQVVTQKNNLQAEVDKANRIVTELNRKAAEALQSGNRELARQFWKEKALHELMLPRLQQYLAVAIEAAERAKDAVRQEEEQIRARTVEAIMRKTYIKQAQLQESINSALEGFSTPAISWEWTADREREFEEWASTIVSQETGAEMQTLTPPEEAQESGDSPPDPGSASQGD